MRQREAQVIRRVGDMQMRKSCGRRMHSPPHHLAYIDSIAALRYEPSARKLVSINSKSAAP